MWRGDTIYFLSDRNRIVNIFAYRTSDKSVRQVTHGEGWDIGWANATDGAIIYEMGGRLYELDLADEQSRPIPITINPDLPETRARWVKGESFIGEAGLSPSGARAVFAARGDILTVPAEKGDIRNLTRSTAIHDRDPLWSPDGKSIAYLSDQSGEYELVIRGQDGNGGEQSLTLGEPAFYDLLAWSPDGGRIVYADNHLNIYALDVDSAERTLIDTHAVNWLQSSFDVAFAPDSRWLAYTKVLSNQLSALMIHDFETGASHQVTAGMSEAEAPVFSRDGKYLFFTASTNYGPHASWLDMSSQERPARRGIYVAVLAAAGETPLPPESDEEGAADDNDKNETGDKDDDDNEAGDDDEEQKAEPVIVDLEGLRNRIVALPVAERDYTSLAVAKDGSLFYLEIRPTGVSNEPPGGERTAVNTLRRFDFEDREDKVFKADVASFAISGDGSKLLVEGAKSAWSIVSADKKKADKAKTLALAGMRIRVEPRAEWRHIFEEAWRQMRDYFYDPGMHGADWPAVHDKYSPLVDHVGRREDLNVILIDMIGELVVGHARIFGGDFVKNQGAPTGLLGADYKLENGRYRVARIYTGESWNPFLKAPLAVPGARVSEGEYILAINGRELTADDNIHALLEGTVDKQTVLSVSADANAEGARDVTVEPIASERLLRRWDWIEANRRKVDEATGGRVGYVYLPNTAGAGFTYFNRYFYAQLDKDALIIDERGNSGGQAANYIVDQLTRTYTASWKLRDGALWSTPTGIVPGPKVMLIDMFAGSGGDFLPYSFRSRGGGKLIGTRTWGGLVGGGPGPDLIDGGRVNLPTLGFIHPDGRWAIENEGVVPDIEVEMLPKPVIAGGDPQLEKAIEVILEELGEWQPIMLKEAPPFPTTARD